MREFLHEYFEIIVFGMLVCLFVGILNIEKQIDAIKDRLGM
jgi:hypothetical protein